MTDQRRKLSDLDYKAIRVAVLVQNSTIREVSNTFNVSTKYVKRLISQVTVTDTTQTTICSGCHYTFSDDELQQHWATWTSGGTKELSCGQVIVG